MPNARESRTASTGPTLFLSFSQSLSLSSSPRLTLSSSRSPAAAAAAAAEAETATVAGLSAAPAPAPAAACTHSSPQAIAARIEKDKKHFVGCELVGKTLAIAGLGNIGSMVADAALSLGMNVVGYDPKISVDAAWRLPSAVVKAASLGDAFAAADYVSVNMPYIKGVTHHVISDDVLAHLKPTAHMLNFARGEIVDGAALARRYKNNGHTGKYICDFPDEAMQENPKFICLPHLGASTAEAEDNCARMAADQVMNFLETGTIINSVNFPNAKLDTQDNAHTRICIINENKAGVLGAITTKLASLNLNIAQTLNTSKGEIAYNVVDIDGLPCDDAQVP